MYCVVVSSNIKIWYKLFYCQNWFLFMPSTYATHELKPFFKNVICSTTYYNVYVFFIE